jgi:transposase
MKVVKSYLNGEGGYGYIAKKFNIPSPNNIESWVAAYNEYGEEGLIRKRKNIRYSLDFKLEVVEYYLTTEISYKDLALKVGMNNPTLVSSWVSKFRKEGVGGLSKSKGRQPKMKPKEEKEKFANNNTKVNDSESKRIEELENEVRYLQIENAYLKELRRLRLEETREMKEQQESSTISEEHSS